MGFKSEPSSHALSLLHPSLKANIASALASGAKHLYPFLKRKRLSLKTKKGCFAFEKGLYC